MDNDNLLNDFEVNLFQVSFIENLFEMLIVSLYFFHLISVANYYSMIAKQDELEIKKYFSSENPLSFGAFLYQLAHKGFK